MPQCAQLTMSSNGWEESVGLFFFMIWILNIQKMNPAMMTSTNIFPIEYFFIKLTH